MSWALNSKTSLTARKKIMTDLETALKANFPAECFLPGAKIKEKGRVFSIRKKPEEEVVGINLDKLKDNEPALLRQGEPIADALFLCLSPNSDHFLVIVVELKGTDVSHGIKQVVQTSERFCKNGRWNRMSHSRHMLGWSSKTKKNGHHGKVLAIIVSARSIPQKQMEKKRLKNKRIILQTKSRDLKESLQTLYKWAGLEYQST